MEIHAVLVLLTALLFAALDVSSADNKMAYFKIGGELNLKPDFSDAIRNILWKLKGDLVAEWVKDAVPLDYYGRFEGRTTLDLNTGQLTMKNLSKNDEGLFSFEINNKIQPVSYTSKAIEEVPKPTVVTQPLTCQSQSQLDKCGLSCYGEIKEAGPVTYSWKEGDGVWKEKKESNISITKTDSATIKTFSCMMKNPISEKQSDPKNNPFYVEPAVINVPNPNIGLAVGLTLAIAVLAGLGVLGWKNKEKFRTWLPVKQDSNDAERDNVNEPSRPASPRQPATELENKDSPPNA
ncbi:uncharacterized protein LOC132975673 [Labrus mixtus]|uniref:uncharacterized protein LOC132975673 n=1 Tax=Labrus mixtus TaxID=508554 RepID=UPI0029C0357D|nr:uncharacterized protein LOC132975673 [Labrus mixtus]